MVKRVCILDKKKWGITKVKAAWAPFFSEFSVRHEQGSAGIVPGPPQSARALVSLLPARAPAAPEVGSPTLPESQ